MVSTIALDAGNFLEATTPLFPHLFLPLASLANVGMLWYFEESTLKRVVWYFEEGGVVL